MQCMASNEDWDLTQMLHHPSIKARLVLKKFEIGNFVGFIKE